MRQIALMVMSIALLSGCDQGPWNNPYARHASASNTRFAVFSEPPKTLDPARSYSANEAVFTGQIYEPPLQYDYVKRPFQLTPLTAHSLPTLRFTDKQGQPVAADSPNLAYSIYTLQIQPHIYYQPHPAFAKRSNGQYRYHLTASLRPEAIKRFSDFIEQDTRELTASDYVYEIKRLASPEVRSPILGLMSEHIMGLKALAKTLRAAKAQRPGTWLDLRQYPLAGVRTLDKYRYEITLNGRYPQFIYWLAMPFFAPMPWEADSFYHVKAYQAHNINLNWHPIGTGPYLLSENNPHQRMVLSLNPNYGRGFQRAHHPHIARHIFSLEKESIPLWTKFLQGYYDQSSISADSFDQAIRVTPTGQTELTETLQQRGIQLRTTVSPSLFYMGFNMLDPVVGGYTDKAKHLRQAIAQAIDYEEYISIFLNGRGVIAQSPLPPGIFGYNQNDYDPMLYRFNHGHLKKQTLLDAQRHLQLAGYPLGINPHTQKPLVLNYDVPASSGPDDKARFDWMRKQFAKLGIQLHIRATQYNRFQEKMRTGHAQIFSWGWHADYPDPENFLFLLYSKNSKVKAGGENAANYHNPQYDALFEQMKNLPNGAERKQLIHQMITLLRADRPWIWGYYPKNFQLMQTWLHAGPPHPFANNTQQYLTLQPELRVTLQRRWNPPIVWPLWALAVLLGISLIPVIYQYRKRQQTSQIKRA